MTTTLAQITGPFLVGDPFEVDEAAPPEREAPPDLRAVVTLGTPLILQASDDEQREEWLRDGPGVYRNRESGAGYDD